MEAYCVVCKRKQPMEQAKEKTTSNGRLMMAGKRSSCGTKTSVFLQNKK